MRSKPGRYPSELEEVITTADGRRLLLRPVRPEDAAGFIANFPRFSAEAVHHRFFGTTKTLTKAAAHKLTHVDYDRELALVLTDPHPPVEGTPPEGYGVARLLIDREGRKADFGLIIRDDMTRKGLGRLLMTRLIDYARRRGVDEIVGEISPDNRPMLALCRSLGFVTEPSPVWREPVRARLRLERGGEAGAD